MSRKLLKDNRENVDLIVLVLCSAIVLADGYAANLLLASFPDWLEKPVQNLFAVGPVPRRETSQQAI